MPRTVRLLGVQCFGLRGVVLFLALDWIVVSEEPTGEYWGIMRVLKVTLSLSLKGSRALVDFEAPQC